MSDPYDPVCECGHCVHAHEDDDGDIHECQLCACQQFLELEPERAPDIGSDVPGGGAV